jgi:hypothetical protein
MKSTRIAITLVLLASLPLTAAGREERRTPIVAAIEKISPSVVNRATSSSATRAAGGRLAASRSARAS